MWIDFQNSFTNWFVGKFSVYTPQRFLSHLQYVATLPCESWKSKNVADFDRILTNCWHVAEDTLRTCSYTDCLKTADIDWLTMFWSLSVDVSNQQLNIVQFNVVASSLHRLRSFYAVLRMLCTDLSKIINAIFLWQVT